MPIARKTATREENEGDGPLVFVSYSHLDDQFRKRFSTHMAPLRREGVRTWFDGDIRAGAELDPEIKKALRNADVFVALASPNYLASRYCFEIEYGYALRKAARKRLFVVVVLLRQCQWRHTRMARYKLLPKDGKPVDQWPRRGDAWEDAVDGIRAVVKQVPRRLTTPKRVKKIKPAGPSSKARASTSAKTGRLPITSPASTRSPRPKKTSAGRTGAGSNGERRPTRP